MRALGRSTFLSDYLRLNMNALEQEVHTIPENRLLATNEVSILEGLTQKYIIPPIEIDWEHQSITPGQKTIPANAVDHETAFFMGLNRLSNQTFQQNTLRYQVPITGDGALLQLRPNSFNLSLPNFTVSHGELSFEVNVSEHRRQEAKTTIENYIKWIKQHVENINTQLSAYNAEILVNTPKLLKKKIQDSSKLYDLAADMGIPLKIVDQDKPINIPITKISNSTCMHSAAISYGGTDELVAAKLNAHLKLHGITTWFFPDDAKLGQQLHRTMYEMANDYDRVLLLCSKESLNRPGVINEIEKVLAREAKGGHEILIPIRLDDYVLSEWAPYRPDIASQIRDKVIGKLNAKNFESDETQKQLKKIVQALTRGVLQPPLETA